MNFFSELEAFIEWQSDLPADRKLSEGAVALGFTCFTGAIAARCRPLMDGGCGGWSSLCGQRALSASLGGANAISAVTARSW